MPQTSDTPFLLIEPINQKKKLNWKELVRFRELLFFFAWRTIQIRYKQTILGVFWVVLQPIVTMVVFTIFFGQIAKIESGGIPYPIFSFSGLVPWTFFSGGISTIANSIVQNSEMIKKVFFPRLILPISTLLTELFDFFISFLILLVMILGYLILPSLFGASRSDFGIQFTPNIIFLPFFILLATLVTFGIGLWLAALNVQFRDIRQSTGFIVRLWMFITPVIYPTNLISPEWQIIYALNPMVGVIEGFRWSLLGLGEINLTSLLISVVVAVLALYSGLHFFNQMEQGFADIV